MDKKVSKHSFENWTMIECSRAVMSERCLECV